MNQRSKALWSVGVATSVAIGTVVFVEASASARQSLGRSRQPGCRESRRRSVPGRRRMMRQRGLHDLRRWRERLGHGGSHALRLEEGVRRV